MRAVSSVLAQLSPIRAEIKVPSAKEAEHPLQPAADQQINKRKENRRQCGHDENHDRGQRDLTARGPDNFRDLGADLLNELKRVCHLFALICWFDTYTA